MRAPSAFLRSLSLRRIQPRQPVAVAPLPVTTRFDRELTAELHNLQSKVTVGGELGLAQLLDVAFTTQKIAMDSLVNTCYIDHDADRGAVDQYLENNVDVLDACNYFVDRMENMKKYVDSLRVAARLVDNGAATTRALDHLESCEDIEKKCKAMEKRGSCLMRRILRQKVGHETEFSEIVCGSKAMALMGCWFLELALSFDSSSKLGLPCLMKQAQPTSSSWLRLLHELAKQAEGSNEKKQLHKGGTGVVMILLQETVTAARELKEQLKGKSEKDMKSAVERVKRSCKELEDVLELIEGRVKDLYRSLIDVRMALLGILSQA